jgi:hypothetical protein
MSILFALGSILLRIKKSITDIDAYQITDTGIVYKGTQIIRHLAKVKS